MRSRDAGLQRRARLKLWLAGFACVAAVAGFAAKPAYDLFKRLRAGNLAERCIRHLQENELSEAATAVKAALSLDPRSPDANRAMAKLQGSLGNHRRAAAHWEVFFSSGRETFEDVPDYFDALIKSGERNAAKSLLETHALRPDSDRAALNRMRCVWLVSGGEMAEGLAAGRKALAIDPADDSFTLYLAGLLASSEESSDRADGLALLWNLAQKPGARGLGAATALANFSSIAPERLRRLVEILKEAGERSIEREILLCGLRLKLGEDAGAIINDLKRRTGAFSLEEKLAVAEWLLNAGQPGAVFEILPPDLGYFSAKYFRVLVEAGANSGQWTRVRDLLEVKELPLPRHEAEAYRARAAEQMGGFASSEVAWTRARRSAEGVAEHMIWLANIAERYGWIDRAREICRRLASNPLTASDGFTGLIQIEKRHGTTRSLRDVMRELEPYGKESPLRINAEAYLSLLLGEDVGPHLESARRLVEEHPDDMAFKSTLAFALLKADQAEEAVEILQPVEPRLPYENPVFSLIYASALARTNRTNATKRWLERVNRSALRPEEQVLFDELTSNHSTIREITN